MAAPRAPRPAVFLDRDGTLTRESDWVTSPADLVLLDGAIDAVLALERAGYAAVVVTNQSAVARGLITESELDAIHAELAARFAKAGAPLEAIYACPHHPSEGVAPYRRECECRKPNSGLVERAARELGLDLARSWIVGDAERDLAAGAKLGVRGVLVGTGKGTAELARMRAAGNDPRFARDVRAAAELILATDRRGG